MKVDITIGAKEMHQMEFSFDRITGDIIVLMDGERVLEDCASPLIAPVRSYELSIGESEKHTLAFKVLYSDEAEDSGLVPIAIPRLMVTAIT